MPHVIFLLCNFAEGKVFSQSENNTAVSWGSCRGTGAACLGNRIAINSGFVSLPITVSWQLYKLLQEKKDGSLWTGFPPSYWEMLLGNFFQLSHVVFFFFFFVSPHSCSWFWRLCKKHQNLTKKRFFHWNAVLVSKISLYIMSSGVDDLDKSFRFFF